MIHMPHRSVTRFFVPLIDVLLLLFCIFLLMPFANEEEMDKKLEDAEKNREELTAERYERDRESANQVATAQDQEAMNNIAQYRRDREELDRLKNLVNQNPDQRFNFRLIDIDKDDGSLSYVDAQGIRKSIKEASDAKTLITRNLNERNVKAATKGKKLYYYFVYPPESSGYPVKDQVRQYKEWFVDPDPRENRVITSLP